MDDPELQELVDDEDAMRHLIGRKARYLGHLYEVTYLLFDEDMIILSADTDTGLQEDSYGRAHRRVPRVQSLRFRDAQGHPTNIWEDVAFLDGLL